MNCKKRKLGQLCRYVKARPEHPEQAVLHRNDRSSAPWPSECNTESGTRFVNSAHWQTIMKDATKQLENQNIADHSSGEEYLQTGPHAPVLLSGLSRNVDMRDLVASLPTRQLADKLVLRCLESDEPALMFIHPPTFQCQYRKFWQSPCAVSPAWLALLYGVLSCGAWIEKTMNPVMVESELPDLFHYLREKCAVSIAKSDLTAPGCYKVEAALMYMGIEYLGSNNSKTGVSILLGIISRLAIMMGYHRSTHLYHPPLRPFEVEMRRRCWLLLSVTDSIVALQSGLPRVIYQGLGDFTRPRNLLYEDLDPTMSSLPPSRPETETPSCIMYMLALDDMLSVANEITDITSKGAITPERTIGLDQELKATRDRLPGALRMPLLKKAPEAQSDITIMQHTLEMIYQRSRCILHRQYLVSPQPTDIYRAFRWASVDAARCVLEYQCELFQDVLRSLGNRQRVWFGASRSVSDCLTAAMVICLDVINESKAAQPFSESTRTELIQLLHKTYLSLKDTPRPSVEIAKAAERVATMLCQMGHAVTEGGLRCSQPAAAVASQLPNYQLADHTAAPEEGASFPYTAFEDFLNGDNPLELFDWGLWDWEVQQFNSPLVEIVC
ncbi:hypothetical protein NYO67_9904 [Aspergillus flavus]|nr:hypothetical protein NYO67_9904 [Aspergillus flavus]